MGDLPGGNVANGQPLWMWDCMGSWNQQWTFDGGAFVLADNSWKACVDVPSNDLSNGNKLWVWECGGWPQQQWGYDPDQKTIYLASSSETQDATKCFDLATGGQDNGTPVQ